MARTPDPSEAEFVRRVREQRPPSREPGRHRARRAAMQLLYRVDLTDDDVATLVAKHEQEHGAAMPAYGEALALDVERRREELDEIIQRNLRDWTVARLGAVERSVLRVAVLELERGDVPAPIVIDEAVELAKRYATPEAGSLVNGVLAGWLRTNERDEHQEEE